MGSFLGERLFELRESKDITQQDLGDAIGISNMSISKWETEKAVPRKSSIRKLCRYFGVDQEFFTIKGMAEVKITAFGRGNRVYRRVLYLLDKGKLTLKDNKHTENPAAEFLITKSLMRSGKHFYEMGKAVHPVPGKLHLVKTIDDSHYIARCFLAKDDVIIYAPDSTYSTSEETRAFGDDEVTLLAVVLKEVTEG